jgi:peptide/nickel transport system ATP-binding protein
MSTGGLSVRNLTAAFHTDRGVLRAVEGVSFEVPKGTTVALVGESGCGKSVTALSILRLLPDPPASVSTGSVRFLGGNLLELPEREMRRVRGAQVAMVFQEPMTSLNPVHTVGRQIGDVLRIHGAARGKRARERALEMLGQVGIPAPELHFDAFPHQLSAGLRQRAMIAMALACNPALLVADEPTAALDAALQAQVIQLFRQHQREREMSILVITHDLGLVAELAEQVVVMYAGQVVEIAPVDRVFASPAHPYTQSLLASVPPSRVSRNRRPRRLKTIDGVVPDLTSEQKGCRFRSRCARFASLMDGTDRCRENEPDLVHIASGQTARCHFPQPDRA